MFQEEIFWQNKEPPKDYPYEIILAGHTSGAPYEIFRPCPPRLFVIGYVIKGKGYINHENSVIKVGTGDTFVIGPGKPHSYYADNDDPWDFIWINIRGNLVNSLASLFGLTWPSVHRSVKCRYLIEQIHCYCSSAVDVLSLCSLASSKVLELIQEVTRSNFISSEKLSLAETVKSMLDGAVLGKISLAEIAEELEYSDVHINRIFKNAYGETPHKYLVLQKLNYAAGLLSDTTMSVSEIASMLGFSDEFHFSNSFYKHFGIRPRMYRKNNPPVGNDE